LRLKKSMKVCCHKCEVLSFLTQEKWKSTGEIDAVTHNTSKLTKNYQNEEKLNDICRPVVRKRIYEGLSCGSMNFIDADD